MNTFTFDNLHNGKDLFSSIFDKRKNSENKTITPTPTENKVLQEAKKENISTNLSEGNKQLSETTSTTTFTGPEMYHPKSQEPEEINSQDALDGLSSWSQLFELEKQETNQRLDEINKAWEEHKGPQVDKAKITQEIEEAWSIRKEQKKQEETENLAFYTLSGPNINLSSTKETNKFICDMLKDEIIIDTTIWEDEKLDFFWMQLIACHERLGKKIVLDSSVWDEINWQNQSPITSHHYAISQIATNRIKNLISKKVSMQSSCLERFTDAKIRFISYI